MWLWGTRQQDTDRLNLVSRLLYGELTYQRYFQPSGQAAVGQHEGNLADH